MSFLVFEHSELEKQKSDYLRYEKSALMLAKS